MKIEITMKTPDAVDYAIKDALEYNEELESIDDEYEREIRRDELENDFKEFLDQWFKYGEVVTIMFDTEKNTATVLK